MKQTPSVEVHGTRLDSLLLAIAAHVYIACCAVQEMSDTEKSLDSLAAMLKEERVQGGKRAAL